LSFLRRFSIILFGLLFITIITVAVLVPDALRSIALRMDGISTPLRLVLVIVVDIIILSLVYTLIRHRRVVNKGGLVVKTGGGNVLADVSPASARERVLKVIREIPNVVSAEAKLDAIDGKADIDMDVVVDGDHISVPDKHKEIDRALRQVVIKQLGLQLASRPRVHIRLLAPGEVLPVPEPAPVAPVVETPTPLPPPAPVAPVIAPPVASAPPTPAIGVDEAVSDSEVSAQYGLIGRRTDQYKAAPVQSPAPAVEPAPTNAPEPEYQSNWLRDEPTPAAPAPVISTPEPEYKGNWLLDDDTPPAPVVVPNLADIDEPKDDEPLVVDSHSWLDKTSTQPAGAVKVDDAEPAPPTPSGGFLRQWGRETPVVDPIEDDDDGDIEPVKFGSIDIDPIGQELESLDDVAASVEDRGNVRVYTMPEPDFADATTITPIPTPSPAPVEESDDDSTVTPPTVLYDDTGEDDEPESGDAGTRSKFP
jgi:hypothetical protein